MATKGKKQLNIINPDTIHDQIIDSVNNHLVLMGYDLNDPKSRKSILHNDLNYCLKLTYNDLFKPDKPLFNNQASLIDYDNNDLLKVIADTFIEICFNFNKSLGLVSFGWLCGISNSQLYEWINNRESNPERSRIIKSIQENHKAIHIGLLNDTPVGAMAVANNDTETGLEWSKQQAALTASNQVFILPSERLDKLRLDKVQE